MYLVVVVVAVVVVAVVVVVVVVDVVVVVVVHLGAKLAQDGPMLAHLGSMLGPSWGYVGRR